MLNGLEVFIYLPFSNGSSFRFCFTKFHLMITVQKPREQVADAEALLDIACTLVTSVKSQTNEGVTPSDFVTTLLRNFGEQNGGSDLGSTLNNLHWSDVGHAVSHVFRSAPGYHTM